MKIGLVCPYDFNRHGAVQKLIALLDSELTSRGHDVRIVTPRPMDFSSEAPERTIFAGKSAKWNTPMSTTLEIGASLDMNGIDEMLEREKFDLINVHEPEVPWLGGQIISHARCPVVATFHATVPDNAMGKTIEAFRAPLSRAMFKKMAAMTAVSDSAARFVNEVSGNRAEIVPNYIDLKVFSKYSSLERDSNMILYLGRLEKRKGVKFLLKAFAELAKSDSKAHLVIAGDGSDANKLKDFVEDYEIPRVEFVGAVSDDEKVKLLRKAAVYSSPAVYGESFGVVLLEAMASGTPIVAGDNSGYKCVMVDKGLISLVNPKDTADFARRLQIFLRDQEFRKSWLEWSNDYVLGFDSVKIIDKYEKVYKKVHKAYNSPNKRD